MCLSPTNSFREVGKLSLNVGLATRHVKGPVTNRQPYVVEPVRGEYEPGLTDVIMYDLPSSRDGSKVGLCDPCVPVSL